MVKKWERELFLSATDNHERTFPTWQATIQADFEDNFNVVLEQHSFGVNC